MAQSSVIALPPRPPLLLYNPAMTTQLDNTMEQASQALAKMDYLTSETLCEDALHSARQDEDWAYYARILLPLQECRRQRRMIALEGIIRLGTASLIDEPAAWLIDLPAGCIVLTHPHTAADAKRLRDEARRQRRYVEVLFADNSVNEPQWKLSSFDGPAATVLLPAPPAAQRDRWLSAQIIAATDDAAVHGDVQLAAQWFIESSEKLGDALARSEFVEQAASPTLRIEALESVLRAAGDHEILHQRLAAAAKAARVE